MAVVSQRRLLFSFFTLVALLASLLSVSAIEDADSATPTPQQECPACLCPECPICPVCPVCSDCSAATDKLAKTTQALEECTKEMSDVQTSLESCQSAAAEEQTAAQTARAAAQECLAAKASSESCCAEGSNHWKTVEAERDTLIDARRELAAFLEECEASEAKLESKNKDLEANVDTLTKTTDGLVKGKAKLARDVDAAEARSEALSKKLKDETLRLTLEINKVDAILNLYKTELDVCSSVQPAPQFIFSKFQFQTAATKIWTFTKSTVLFTTRAVLDATKGKIPPQLLASVSKKWEEKTGFVSELWSTKMQPKLENAINTVSTNDMTIKSRRLYESAISPHVSSGWEQTKQLASHGWNMSQQFIVVCSGKTNDFLNERVVHPLVASNPDLKPLIPDAPLDRLFFTLFVVWVLTLLVTPLRLFCCLVCLLLKLLNPCCWCRLLCCRGGSSAATTKTAKAKKPRKTFAPATAAAGTSSAGASTPPTAGGKNSGAHQRSGKGDRR